jgi:hypothetical protein
LQSTILLKKGASFMHIEEVGGHLDQMLRQTRAYHIQLVSMADLKANILLTLASVVITLTVRYLSDSDLRIAAIILIASSLMVIFLSIYTVMPKMTSGLRRNDVPDFRSSTFNLLFYNDFLRLDYPAYAEAMEEVMNDPSSAYEVQVRDLYILGQFLAKRKYRFLKMAYLVFMLGIFISGLAWLLM